MIRHRLMPCLVAAMVMAGVAGAASADELRNIKTGSPLPAYKLPTIDNAFVDSEAAKDSVVVLVYLSAEQRSSELAMVDSAAVVKELKDQPVKLFHVTADVVSKPYFEKLRTERKLDAPLAFDADRTLYHQLGLIVFPTTVITDKQGKLIHVISLRGPDYSRVLDAYIRHALGQLTPAQLQEKLKATSSSESSPKSLAAAHRAAARFQREKGNLAAAKEELTKANEQDPADHEVQLDLADVDLSLGAFDDADRLIADVLKAQPDHRRAKQLKGIGLYHRNQLDDAERVLVASLPLNPDPDRVHYYLGLIYEQKGQAPKALEHYREALRHMLKEPEAKPAPSAQLK